ncbi:hypothetical protein [Kamptonema formosum]|uniref:hypothetical protein n=1 Tax=Kamptonema formosum TaxID=331992 RepID=UPI000348A2E3|nr:hypothetical protein [Oscillatoria sp. PCC 10802]
MIFAIRQESRASATGEGAALRYRASRPPPQTVPQARHKSYSSSHIGYDISGLGEKA